MQNNTLTTQDKKYLKQFSKIDLAQVKQMLAQGSQHKVFRYKTDEVIKIPLNTWYMEAYGLISLETIKKEIQLLQTYMPEFLAETEVIVKDEQYVIKQKHHKRATELTSHKIAEIKSDFKKLLEKNNQMLKEEGYSLDFFGFNGVVSTIIDSLTSGTLNHTLSNVMIEDTGDTKRLLIIDTNLSNCNFNSKKINVVHKSIDWMNSQMSQHILHNVVAQ